MKAKVKCVSSVSPRFKVGEVYPATFEEKAGYVYDRGGKTRSHLFKGEDGLMFTNKRRRIADFRLVADSVKAESNPKGFAADIQEEGRVGGWAKRDKAVRAMVIITAVVILGAAAISLFM